MWWILKRMKIGRWFFVKTVTEFLYDLEAVNAMSGTYDGIKKKWLDRLEILDGKVPFGSRPCLTCGGKKC
jgi:hypothetical protein